MRRPRRAYGPGAHALLVVALLLATVAIPGAYAQEASDDRDGPLARQVKAAFLFRFLAYVEWPASAFGDSASPIVLGVLGSDAIVAEVKDVIGDRLAQGRAIVVRRHRHGEPLSGTHVLYVTAPYAARLAALAREAAYTATLVVSDAEGALAQGSMINFRVVGERVRFDIALAAAERAGLRVSARLLEVARSVRSSL